MIEAGAKGSEIDTVSGATITTEAVRNAVDDALDQARVEAVTRRRLPMREIKEGT